MAEIWRVGVFDQARMAVKAFQAAHSAKLPEVVATITGDLGELLAFYDHPASH